MVSSRDNRCPCASLIEKVENCYCTTVSWIIPACVVVKQNSVILTSCNSGILIIQHFWIIVQIPKVLLFLPEKASLVKQADLRYQFKSASKNICTSKIVLSPDLLFPIPSTSSAMKTPVNPGGDDDDWASRWRKYPNGILLWLIVQHKCRSSSKKLPAGTYISIDTI